MQRRTINQDISSNRTHHILQSSTTLNRRYVRRPASLSSTTSPVSKPTSSSINKKSNLPTTHKAGCSVNVVFKAKTQLKESLTTTFSQPKNLSITPQVAPPQPRKRPVLDNYDRQSSNKFTPIFDQQSKMEQAFSLVSEQEKLLLEPTRPLTPIFTNTSKKSHLLNSRPKAPRKTSSQSHLKPSLSKPVAIPATNMTTGLVNSTFARNETNINKVEKNNQDSVSPSLPTALKKSSPRTLHKKRKRLFFAFVCSTAVVASLFFIIQSNMPDISVRVAAMQTGIQASYPSYIPREYRLSGVYTAQDNSVAMDFTGPNNAKFTLTEEKLPWDSTTLLNRFVKNKWGENYDSIREQGITIYISGSNAAWVNAGIVYKITNFHGELTKKQIKNIVTSL